MADGQTTEIALYGTVGESFWGEQAFNALDVRETLSGVTGDITVRLNSGGGIASEGQAIYNILRQHDGRVTLVIDGIAASAASLIAMAGDDIVMMDGAILMIHDPAQPWIEGRGTEADHLRAAESLAILSRAYAKVYAKRAGISVDAAREIMRAETYYDGEQAVAAGFATRVAEDPAQAVAAFDYAIYANAPGKLLAGRLVPRASKRVAVAALMAGVKPSNPKQKEPIMAEQDTLAGDGEDTMAAGQNDTMAADGEDTMPVEDDDTLETEEDEDEDENEAAPTAAVAIALAAERFGLGAADVADMLSRRLTVGQAITEMSRKSKGPAMTITPGAPRTRILRDERETRRVGMTAAIAAQVLRRNPTDDQARPFMAMTLAEMAAQSAGYKGSLRHAGGRVEAFTMAYSSHSTSDFPGILDGAMNKVLLERYTAAQPIYQRLARRRDFRDFRPHAFVRAGDFPMMKKVVEGGEIKFGTIGESSETLTLGAYASGATVTRQVLINDDLGALEDALADYGTMIARFEEATFFAGLNSALADGKAVYHADHKNIAASGAAIGIDTIGVGRAAIRSQTSINGQKLNLFPSILLVGPNNETAAEQLVTAITAVDATKVNPFAGKLVVEVTPEITDTSWYLLASPTLPGGSIYTYGYLEGAAAPRVRTNEPFGQQGLGITVEHDFVAGPIDYRGGYKNAGA